MIVAVPTAPHSEVTAKGDIVYTEFNRENVGKLEAHVEEIASDATIPGNVNPEGLGRPCQVSV